MGIAAGAGALISGAKALGIGAGAADRRQLKQQGKLQDLSIKGSKEMTDYNKEAELEMWKNTNWAAQRAEAEKAGLSVGWLMGKGGGQGGTTGSGGMSVGMGQAADGASRENAKTQQMMAAAQIANLNADTEKKQVEAGKLGGVDTDSANEDVVGKKFNNALNATLRETIEKLKTSEGAIKGIEAEEKNADWEAKKAVGYNTNNYSDVNSRIAKQMIAEMEMESVKLENAKKSGNLMEAEQIIKNFEAELTKEGIAPNSPFYVKILGDLLGKIGLNPITGLGGGK